MRSVFSEESMFYYNRVVWSEGMLLQQQHLQQHDRYLHRLIDARCAPRGRYGWGFAKLDIDEAQLAFGKFSLRACEGVMPDGTPFSLPGDGDLPAAIDVPESKRDAQIVLALALARAGMPEVDETTAADSHDARAARGVHSSDGFQPTGARYRRAAYQVEDTHARTADSVVVEVARLQMRLAFADEIGDAFAVAGVARVIERRADQRLVIDGAYMPPCVDYRVAPPLSAFVDELIGMLDQRAQMLSVRLAGPGIGAVDELADFLLLQVVNRYRPLLTHWAMTESVHPEALYGALLQLAGELAGLTRGAVPPLAPAPYRHHALAGSFAPVIETIREALSYVAAPHAIALALEARPHGLQVARVADSTLFAKAGFVLTACADMPADALAAALPLQLKVGPLEKIDDLVNLQLPGIGLRVLPAAPRQLPFHAQRCYLSLDANDALWPQLAACGALALHVAGDFPGLELGLWAIKQ
jgi:type VI secretion system protein ImpJ